MRAVVVAVLGPLVGVGLVIGLGLGLAAPAAAHDQLVSTSPADGAVLDSPPALVELTFSNAVADLGSVLVVEDAVGQPVQDAPPTIDGTVVRSPLPPDVGLGTYVVRWRVVAQDGHPIEGSFTFTVSDAVGSDAVADPATATDAPSAGATDVPAAAGSPGATSTATADSTATPALADDVAPDEGGSRLAPLLGGLLAVGAVAGVLVAVVRRRRSGAEAP